MNRCKAAVILIFWEHSDKFCACNMPMVAPMVMKAPAMLEE